MLTVKVLSPEKSVIGMGRWYLRDQQATVGPGDIVENIHFHGLLKKSNEVAFFSLLSVPFQPSIYPCPPVGDFVVGVFGEFGHKIDGAGLFEAAQKLGAVIHQFFLGGA
jgi:hypothetical protein